MCLLVVSELRAVVDGLTVEDSLRLDNHSAWNKQGGKGNYYSDLLLMVSSSLYHVSHILVTRVLSFSRISEFTTGYTFTPCVTVWDLLLPLA